MITSVDDRTRLRVLLYAARVKTVPVVSVKIRTQPRRVVAHVLNHEIVRDKP